MKHKKYGGSSAARQIMCPSWTEESSHLPQQGTTSIYAEEGTALHDCMEKMMEDADARPEDFLGKEMQVTIDEDHIERLNMALAAYEELCTESGYDFDDYMAEIAVELTPDIGGTSDLVLWGDEHIAVIDWKFGQGVEVSPVDNAQGLFYAMCARHELPDLFKGKKLLLVIIQPLPSKSAETLKIWEVPAGRLDVFATTYMKSINAKGLNAGAHCQFCPASATCKERSGEAQAALQMDPFQLETLGANLTMALRLKDWIKSVESTSHEQMDLGVKVPGYKLVDKRASRKWSDEDDVEALLRKKKVKVSDFMAPAKMKTPPQLEKVKGLDMSIVSDYIMKVSSGTTLAPESDPREEALSESALVAALKQLT